jgi:hypothetical protein
MLGAGSSLSRHLLQVLVFALVLLFLSRHSLTLEQGVRTCHMYGREGLHPGLFLVGRKCQNSPPYSVLPTRIMPHSITFRSYGPYQQWAE